MEKLSTLPEESDTIQRHKLSKEELNNNINNNNRKLLLLNTQLSAKYSNSNNSLDECGVFDSLPGTPERSQSVPGTPCTPTAGDWVGVGTYRRRKISKERAKSLREENEELGLENVIPRHKSPKALAEMGKLSLLICKKEKPTCEDYIQKSQS